LEHWDVAVAGGLVRFIVDQGRATMLAIVGSALQALSVIWEAVRS
jgi:hypothetical protein